MSNVPFNRALSVTSQNFLWATIIKKIKRYFLAFIKAESFVYHFIIELWPMYSSKCVFEAYKPDHYGTSFHVFNCLTALFEICHSHWINIVKVKTVEQTKLAHSACYCTRNDGATEATFGLLMSQSELSKVIFIICNEKWMSRVWYCWQNQQGEVCFDQEHIWSL